MTTDLVLVESASLRSEHMDRVDVLDKVKALRLLPNGTEVDRAGVAHYYEVPEATIKSLAQRHADELKSNGMRSVAGQEFRATVAPNSPAGRGRPSGQLFTLRAVLNVGMLLRDSRIARQVRSYLLDAEEPPEAFPVPRTLSEALRFAADQADRAEEAERRAVAGEAFKRAIEAGDGLTIREFNKKYFSEVPERVFNRHLYDRGWLINQQGTGSWDAKQKRYRDGWQHRHPASKGKRFFYRHGSVDGSGARYESTYVRSGQFELGLRDRLAGEGLPSNEQPGLFAIEGGAA